MSKFLRALALMSVLLSVPSSTNATQPSDRGALLWEELNQIQQSEGVEAADTAFSLLSEADQHLVLGFITGPTTITEEYEVNSDIGTNAIGCYVPMTRTLTVENFHGGVFYRYSQEIQWCGNGSAPYNRTCLAYPWDTGWGYSFVNHITYCQLNPQGYQFNYFSQGHFCAGVASVGMCVVDSNGWVRQYGNADGYYWSEVGI